jgi:integrase
MKTKGVNKVTVRGRVYYYDRRTGERLPDDETARQKRMLEIARGAVVKQSNSGRGTIGDLIARYRASPHFHGLAKRSRETYGKHLAHLEADFGDISVKYVDREWLVELRDSMAATPRMADQCIQVIRILLDYALDRQSQYQLQFNAARDIKAINVQEHRLPWPDALVDAFRASTYPDLRLIVELGLGTGARISDCCAMLWSSYDGAKLTWKQIKTKTTVSVPVTSALKALLDGTPKKAAVIATTKTGRPWRPDHLRPELQRAVEALGYRGYSFHGLRHRTGMLLAEAGCTPHEIMAVLGHKSLAMATLYSMQADRAKLAGSAIVKMEQNRMPVLQNSRKGGGEGK